MADPVSGLERLEWLLPREDVGDAAFDRMGDNGLALAGRRANSRTDPDVRETARRLTR